MFAPRCAPTHVTPDTPRAFIAYKPRPCNNRCLRQHARILTQPSTPRFCSKSSLWPQAHLKLGCGCVSRSMAKLIFGDFFGAMPREKPSSPCKHPPGVLHLAFSFTGHFFAPPGPRDAPVSAHTRQRKAQQKMLQSHPQACRAALHMGSLWYCVPGSTVAQAPTGTGANPHPPARSRLGSLLPYSCLSLARVSCPRWRCLTVLPKAKPRLDAFKAPTPPGSSEGERSWSLETNPFTPGNPHPRCEAVLTASSPNTQ